MSTSRAAMSAERVAEIKARAEAADEGPWAVDEMLMVESDAGAIGDFYFQPESEAEFTAMKADAVFAAAARTDVPDLLAEVQRLRAAVPSWADLRDLLVAQRDIATDVELTNAVMALFSGQQGL